VRDPLAIGGTRQWTTPDQNAVNSKVGQLLIDRGADLSIRARVTGHYERPGEILDVSAEYGALFPLR